METYITSTEPLPKWRKEQNHSDNRICGPIISEEMEIKATI